MNARQRRRLVRQYADKVQLDRITQRLQGMAPRWCDSTNFKRATDRHAAQLDYFYTLDIRSKEKKHAHSRQQTL